MNETAYLTLKEFQQQIINWSRDTIKRRIKDEKLPAIKDTGGYIFDRKAVDLWFKRRKAQP